MTGPRVASVATHLRCNQKCVFCTRRSERDEPRFVAGAGVRARIGEALSGGASEVTLTGGEPSMRGDLADLVRHARESGAQRVVVETNATLLDGERARALKAAGVDLARVHVPALDGAYDALTRDPGGFARAMAGMKALAAAGVPLEAALTLTASTSPQLAAIPGRLRAELGPALVGVVVAFAAEAADDRELLSFAAASRAVLALERAVRPLGLELRMSAGDWLPPCVFDREALPRAARLYAMTAGVAPRAGYSHLGPCNECRLRDRCPGVPDATVARFGPPPLVPVTEERARRRMAVVSSVREQMRRELVTRSLARAEDGSTLVDETIRVVFRCNQSCTFCFVSTHLPAPQADEVEAAIRAAAARGSRIVLSGGEPTLHPRLLEWVRLARTLSRRDVVLQTNATRLSDRTLVAALEEAGLGEAFVSLHGATAEVSDAVTEAPGTFVQTVAGLDHLHRSRIRLVLNYVVCEKNRHQLVDHVRAVAARWPRASLNLSFVAPSSDLVPRDRGLVPRYSDALPAIAEAVREARRLGVPVGGFESMCGLPLCLVPREVEALATVEVPEGFDGGEFLKTDECARCSLRGRCWGLRRGYAETHGTGELRAR